MNYYRRYVGDYHADTPDLTMAEHGAYGLLMDYLYATEGPIKDAAQAMEIAKARTEEELFLARRVLKRFFYKISGGFTNKRFQKELRLYKKQCKKNQTNGLKGGRPKTQPKPSGNPSGNPKEPNPSSNIQPPIKDLKSSPTNIDDLKKSVLSKSHDPNGQVAAMVEIICERAERSGVTIRSEAYLTKALDNFNVLEGQDREELMQRMRRTVN